jgi:hypothetical protein
MTHLRLKAHIEHAIGLVKDKIRDALEVDQPTRIGREQLNHTTRRTNEYFRAPLHVIDIVF